MPRKTVQMLRIEQDLATARRALYRAEQTAEAAGYMQLGDGLRMANSLTSAVFDAVIKGAEHWTPPVDLCAYLGYLEPRDRTAPPREPMHAGPPDLHQR